MDRIHEEATAQKLPFQLQNDLLQARHVFGVCLILLWIVADLRNQLDVIERHAQVSSTGVLLLTVWSMRLYIDMHEPREELVLAMVSTVARTDMASTRASITD
eukprot:scaffold1439_cov404-Prasinococcus_capsulatus_cf.AAC.15